VDCVRSSEVRDFRRSAEETDPLKGIIKQLEQTGYYNMMHRYSEHLL